MLPNLKKMFNRVPKTAFEIRQTKLHAMPARYNLARQMVQDPVFFKAYIVDTFNITGMSHFSSMKQSPPSLPSLQQRIPLKFGGGNNATSKMGIVESPKRIGFVY
jgi:hypothetical protein